MIDKYRVHEIARFNYSDIGEYIDENHTDRPLRNDILVELLNELHEENVKLKQSNKDAWNLLRFIYEEIKEEGSMDWGRIQDLVEF